MYDRAFDPGEEDKKYTEITEGIMYQEVFDVRKTSLAVEKDCNPWKNRQNKGENWIK